MNDLKLGSKKDLNMNGQEKKKKKKTNKREEINMNKEAKLQDAYKHGHKVTNSAVSKILGKNPSTQLSNDGIPAKKINEMKRHGV
jgi:hypothetical protein